MQWKDTYYYLPEDFVSVLVLMPERPEDQGGPYDVAWMDPDGAWNMVRTDNYSNYEITAYCELPDPKTIKLPKPKIRY